MVANCRLHFSIVLLMRKYISVDHSIFAATLLLYLFNELVIKNYFSRLYFFRFYFNDFLAPILVLSFWNSILIHKGQPRIVSNRQLFIFGVLCSICWEWLALYIKPESTFDVFDMLAYFAGVVVYKIVIVVYQYARKSKPR